MAKNASPLVIAERFSATLDDHVQALQWSADGRSLAAAAVSGPITLFDGQTGAVKHQLAGHGFGTTAVAFHPNGKSLASCGQDGKIRFWDVATGAQTAEGAAGAAWAECLVWSKDGKTLVTAAGKKLKLWDAKGEFVRDYPDQPATVAALTFSPKGKELAVARYGGVAFYQIERDETREFGWKGSVLALAFSPDGKYLAGGAQDSSVHFWVMKTGEDLHMSGYPVKVRELAWSSDGSLLATGGGSAVVLWDCTGKGPAGTKPTMLDHGGAAGEFPLSALTYQTRGGLLASGCQGGIIHWWQPELTSRSRGNFDLGEPVTQLAWSPDDRRLAIGGAGGAVRVLAVS